LLQVAPQLLGPLSIISPPETPPPKKPLDTPNSSQGISALERLLPARFKRINKNRGSQPPDQLATKSGRLVDLGFNSQSRSRENTPKRGPPTMAAGQRVRVSILFAGRQTILVSDELSQRAVAKPVNWVCCLVSLSAPLFMLHNRIKEIRRKLK